MGNIVLLDDLTINKIAAGEVIERPASVVKEMVENSIDAGATNITVEIKNGGISYIRISDNGKGIAQDDLEIAFERHATSKIRSAEDLDTVMSMGFRGEALASIAAIANVELISKTESQETGYKVVIEGGDILEKEETGCKKGTTITVRNLFFNTPVRYKFLKKDYTESGYIEDAITRIALVHPEIAFKLINSGKTIIQTTGNNDLKSVIYSIYGKEISEGVLDVDYKYEDIEIKGVIGKAEIARSNRTNQIFFVNKRYVKDKTLSSAIEQALKGMLPIGKFAFAILNLEMNPSKVDVNVHPAKLEVRFEEEYNVFNAVYNAINNTLLQRELIENPKQEINTEKKENINKYINENIKESNQELNQNNEKIKEDNEKYNVEIPTNSEEILVQLKNLKSKLEEEVQNNSNNETNINISNSKSNKIEEHNKIEENNSTILYTKESQKEKQSKISVLKEKIEQLENNREGITEDFKNMYKKLFGTKPVDENEIKMQEDISSKAVDIIKDNVNMFENLEEYKTPVYKYIGIAFNTYIILEVDKELYILDQHAAHERILYEKVKKNYYNQEIKDSQMMLLPDIITLTHKEMDIAKENMKMFEKAGFILEEFGENTIKLSGVPDMCIDLDTKELFLETLDEINSVARTAKQEIEERFLATVACKAAVKAHMVLAREEVESLLNELLLLPNPFTCPHGRPTAIKMTKYDIERKFARK